MYIITQMDQNANNLAKFFPQNGRSRISLRSVGIQTTSPFVVSSPRKNFMFVETIIEYIKTIKISTLDRDVLV